jgi:hypothetical protein
LALPWQLALLPLLSLSVLLLLVALRQMSRTL